jgi:hypothetical protein
VKQVAAVALARPTKVSAAWVRRNTRMHSTVLERSPQGPASLKEDVRSLDEVGRGFQTTRWFSGIRIRYTLPREHTE